MSFNIDGAEYPVVCEVKRTSKIKATDISGFMMDGRYFNDVMGTYLVFNVVLGIPFWAKDCYDTLYEALNDPVDGHMVEMPYNKSSITINARIEQVDDSPIRGSKYWKDISFQVISNAPTKQMGLEEVISRGHSPLPELDNGEDGDCWIYSRGSGWVHEHYDNADDMYF